MSVDLETMPTEQRQKLASEANRLYTKLLYCRRGLSPWNLRAQRLERLTVRALRRLQDRDLMSKERRGVRR